MLLKKKKQSQHRLRLSFPASAQHLFLLLHCLFFSTFVLEFYWILSFDWWSSMMLVITWTLNQLMSIGRWSLVVGDSWYWAAALFCASSISNGIRLQTSSPNQSFPNRAIGHVQEVTTASHHVVNKRRPASLVTRTRFHRLPHFLRLPAYSFDFHCSILVPSKSFWWRTESRCSTDPIPSL